MNLFCAFMNEEAMEANQLIRDVMLAYIPPELNFENREMFDPEYMRALFDYAYQQSKNGYPWAKSPADFISSE